MQVRSQESDVDALVGAKARLAEIEQEVTPLSVTLEQADKVAKISAELEQYKQNETALDTKVEQAASAQSERDQAGATLRDLGSVGQLTEEDKSKLDQSASRTATLREECARHQGDLEQYERDMSTYVEAKTAYEQSREAY